MLEWGKLLYLTHVDRAGAATAYTEHYLATSGQLYWSDLHQRSEYIGNYHRLLDQATGDDTPGTEIITEIYVPRPALAAFLRDAAAALRGGDPPFVYGTIRLVERDDEAVLTWAREAWACVIFNLHTEHDPVGMATVRRGVPDAHRYRDPTRWQLLPDLPSVRPPGAAAAVPSAAAGVPRRKGPTGSRGAVPERLVPPHTSFGRGRLTLRQSGFHAVRLPVILALCYSPAATAPGAQRALIHGRRKLIDTTLEGVSHSTRSARQPDDPDPTGPGGR